MFDRDTGWYTESSTFRREMSCADNRNIYPYTNQHGAPKRIRNFRAAIGAINGVWWGTVNEPENMDSEQRFGENFITKVEAQSWCWDNLTELVNGVGR